MTTGEERDGADVDEPNGDPAVESASPDENDDNRESGAAPETRPVPDTPVEPDEPVDPGEVLFHESGGSWLAVLVGPVLVVVVLIMEIAGPGQVHWPVLTIFFVILGGFGWIQRLAAQQHISVTLTERTLRQGTKTIDLADIAKIYPANNSAEPKDWESAPALGELSGVPRRRKGIGVKLADGRIKQAWARNDEVFRSELTQAWQAVKMGL